MIHNRKVLAIIPARSGSKGLANKNIKMLNGKPLLGWPINAAMKSRYIDKVLVSTDSKDYRDIALEQAPIDVLLRPAELATDDARSIDVILHVLNTLSQYGDVYDLIVLLEPTSPLTTGLDVDCALEKLVDNLTVDSVVAVKKAECDHPQFAYVEDERKRLNHYTEGLEKVVRRQDLSDVYYLDGSFYISTVAAIEKHESFYTDNTIGFEVPKWKSFEIDDDVDFDIVEMLMKRYNIE